MSARVGPGADRSPKLRVVVFVCQVLLLLSLSVVSCASPYKAAMPDIVRFGYALAADRPGLATYGRLGRSSSEIGWLRITVFNPYSRVVEGQLDCERTDRKERIGGRKIKLGSKEDERVNLPVMLDPIGFGVRCRFTEAGTKAGLWRRTWLPANDSLLSSPH